ncbi:TPA: hypothetical protein NH848_003194 [Pseudomonas aeruginosa]|nr:hypothetical protein [Pseudomonas aeruginosa]
MSSRKDCKKPIRVNPGVKFTLRSPDDEGCLDFTTSVILLNAYSAPNKKLIRSALNPNARKSKLIPEEINAYNLFIHEYTHYLDLTTTTWGMEFLCRRSIALSKILAQGKSALSVAMLNAAEIQMHDDFNLVHRQVKLENLVTKHELIYSERHGTVIIIHLYINDYLVAKTSVSMLSILEANAVAHEYEGEYKWVACTKGNVDKLQHGRIDAKFTQLLENSNRLEYNIIHILVAIHFPKQSLRHRLKIVSTLCHIALNMSSLDLAILANIINDRIFNKHLGDALCNDLCRGMSRQVVVFYLVLMLYEYIEEVGFTTERIAQKIEGDLLQLVNEMLLHQGFEHPLSQRLSDLEFGTYIKALRRDRGKFIMPGTLRAAAFNRKLLSYNRSTSRAFRRLKLPDIILDDHSKIRAPSRIRSNVAAHWESMYDECSELDYLAKDPDVMKKFHMPPGVIGPMQQRREIHFRQLMNMKFDEP